MATSRIRALRMRKFSSARTEAKQPYEAKTVQYLTKNTKTQDHLMPFSITSLLRMSAIIIIFYSTNTPFKFIPWRVNVRTVW